jgi:hypothetical protein
MVARYVAYSLKARTVEPEKQPLLANDSETTLFSMLRLGKHVRAAMDAHATREALLMFHTRSVQRDCKEDNWSNRVTSVWKSVRKRGSWNRAEVQKGLECVKLKNLHC